jgi:hypothetical protein
MHTCIHMMRVLLLCRHLPPLRKWYQHPRRNDVLSRCSSQNVHGFWMMFVRKFMLNLMLTFISSQFNCIFCWQCATSFWDNPSTKAPQGHGYFHSLCQPRLGGLEHFRCWWNARAKKETENTWKTHLLYKNILYIMYWTHKILLLYHMNNYIILLC